jgi:hypothetical protein
MNIAGLLFAKVRSSDSIFQDIVGEDTKETNKHFAGQTIYGIVKSFTKCSDQPGENMEVLAPCSSPSSPLSSP